MPLHTLSFSVFTSCGMYIFSCTAFSNIMDSFKKPLLLWCLSNSNLLLFYYYYAFYILKKHFLHPIYVFILIWTHRLLFYSTVYKASSIVFILCLNCFTPRDPSSYLLCSSQLLSSFFELLFYLFLVQNSPGSSYTFYALVLKRAISPGNLGYWWEEGNKIYWRMECRM